MCLWLVDANNGSVAADVLVVVYEGFVDTARAASLLLVLRLALGAADVPAASSSSCVA